jgi:hypothetical protein
MKFNLFLLLVILDLLLNANRSFAESLNDFTPFEFNIKSSISNSDISVDLKSVNESVQTCGPEQEFKITIKNNLTTESKTLEGILLQLTLPTSYSLSSNLKVKNSGNLVSVNSHIQDGNTINISSSLNLAASSVIEVYFNVTISCNFQSSETISLLTYFNNSNQTFAANNKSNSTTKVNYTRSDYQYVQLGAPGDFFADTDNERAVRFTDLNQLFGSKTKKVKFLYSYPVNEVSVKKLKVKKDDGTFVDIPFIANNIEKTYLQGSEIFNTAFFEIDASVLSLDFMPVTLDFKVVFNYIGCSSANVTYELKQFCYDTSVCDFKSGAKFDEIISVKIESPMLSYSIISDKTIKANNCSSSGIIRYLVENKTTATGYHITTDYRSDYFKNIENFEIYYVYTDSITGKEQFYKFNGQLNEELDGTGFGLDILTRNNSKINFLAPGKSFQIEYRYKLKDLCSNGLNSGLDYLLSFYLNVYDICYGSGKGVYNSYLSSSETIANRVIEGPSDVIENEFTTFSYSPGYLLTTNGENGLIENCANRNYEVKFKIPGTATIGNVKYNNVLINPANLKYNIYDGVSYLTISHSVSNVGNDGKYEIQLKTNDCASATPQRLEFELLTYCGTEDCRKSLCKTNRLTYFHSNQCGTSGCFNTTNFSFKRSSLGWKVNRPVQNNMYYFADLTTKVPSTNQIDLSKAYTDDSVHCQISGVANGKCGDNIVAKIKYLSTYRFFESNEGKIHVINDLTKELITTLIVNKNQISYVTEGNYQSILFTTSFPAISSDTRVTLEFESDLHIRIDQVENGKFNLEDVRGEFLFKSQEYIHGKDSWGTTFTILSVINKKYTHTYSNLYPCTNKIVFGMAPTSTGKQNVFDFENEFRPVTHFVGEQIFKVPSDFVYIPNSMKLGIANIKDMDTLGTKDMIHYYPVDSYSIEENYDSIAKILKINITKSPLIANDNQSILVCIVDIKSSACNSIRNSTNSVNLSFSRRDYAYVTSSVIVPQQLYRQSEFSYYTSKLEPISIQPNSTNKYNIEFSDQNKVGSNSTVTFSFYNYTHRTLGNFWIAFENTLPVDLIFSNVRIGQQVGTVSNYGVNGKYTIVNFGNLPYNFQNQLTFDVKIDKCSVLTDNDKVLPFNMFIGNSCLKKQFSRPFSECQIAPVNFNIDVKNDNAEIQMLLTNSNFETTQTISPIQICDPVYYLATISNSSGYTSINNNVATINFPLGMEIQEVTYQYGNDTTRKIEYEMVNTNQINIDLTAQIKDIAGGFKSENSVNKPIRLKFKFKTNCQFSPSDKNVELNFSYTKYCDERTSLINNDDRLLIAGFENLKDIKLNFKTSNSVPITKVSSNGEVTVSLINNGNITSEASELQFSLPKELKFVSNNSTNVTLTSSGKLVSSVPSLKSGELYTVKFNVNDQYGNKAKEGLRPSACIDQKVVMSKVLTTSCSSTCKIDATLANGKICIPLPPVDSIPVEISCNDCIESFAPYQGSKYVLSAWVKEDIIQNGLTSYTGPAIVLRFKLQENDIALDPMFSTGEIIDGWQRIYQEFTIPSDAQNISVDLINNGNNEVFFDDIRIHPFEANMKSFVYDPISMKLVAELDENNYATFYEYDEEGALVRVKKETQRGIMTIKESRNNTIKK